MTYLVAYLVSIAGVVLLAIVVRFVQPELVYSIQYALLRVRVNKVFFDAERNRIVRADVFPNMLLAELRYEQRDYGDEYLFTRVGKIRELYQLIGRSRPAPGLAAWRKPQVCLFELTNMLAGLGQRVTTDDESATATVSAFSIFAFMGNEARKAEGLLPMTDPEQAVAWFTSRPVSLDQMVEVLIAAVLGFAYRQRAQNNPSAEWSGDTEAATQVKRLAAAYGSDERREQSDAQEVVQQGVAQPEAVASALDSSVSVDRAEAEAVASRHDPSAVPRHSGTTSPHRPQTMDDSIIRVFVSYSHRDKKYLRDGSLLGWLKGLDQEGVEFWYDQEITAGGKWDEKIKERIEKSHIALILVSQYYLDSEYCRNVEIRGFLARAELRGLIMLPVMLSRCEWERHEWLKSRLFLPRDGQTIEDNYTRIGPRKALFNEIRQHLRRHIESARGGLRNPQDDQ